MLRKLSFWLTKVGSLQATRPSFRDAERILEMLVQGIKQAI